MTNKARVYLLMESDDGLNWKYIDFDCPDIARKYAKRRAKEKKYKAVYFLYGILPTDNLALPTIDSVIIKKLKEK